MHARTLARTIRAAHDPQFCEPLEARTLLAAHLVADYFPLDSAATWNYSGTVNGAPATAVASLGAGATIAGVPTTKLSTVFTPSAGGAAATDTRFYASTSTGLRLLREDVIQGGLTTTALFGDGIAFLTPSVSDGAVIHFTRSTSGSTSAGRSWTGTLSGDMTIVGIETIDTLGGSYEALKISLSESIVETGSTGWTATGTVAEARWIVRGIGTVRVDYVSSLTPTDEAASSFRFSLGLKSSSRLGELSDMTVTGKGVVMAYGDTTPGAADGTNFAGMDLNGGTKTRIFKIQNTSGVPMTLSPGSQGFITIAGASASDFTVIRQPAQTILPGQTTLFSVRFDPAALGFRFATVSFATPNSLAQPFAFDIRGTGILIGAINVSAGSATPIVNGATAPRTQDGTQFGPVAASGSAHVSRTFTITNSGIGALVLLGVPRVFIGGVQASDFLVTLNPAASVAPGATTTFTVAFDPAALGGSSATVSIVSNDRFNSVFTFVIAGTGV